MGTPVSLNGPKSQQNSGSSSFSSIKMYWHILCFIICMTFSPSLQTGSTYNIIYTNSDGRTSEREITVHKQWRNYGHYYVKAYCGLTEEERTFRVDRIKEVITSTSQDSFEPKEDIQEVISIPVQPQIKVPEKKAHPQQEYVYKRPAGAHPILVTLSLMFVIFAFLAGFIDDGGRASHTYVSKTAVVPKKTVKPQPQKTQSWQQAIQQRKTSYTYKTGFSNEALLNIYISADTNYDNVLSWQEIDSFQRKINRNYVYRYNSTALTPVEFIAQDGGDCEDWSIFTCGMLKFWGYRAYVGVVDGGNGDGLHAIALFYKKTPPANSSYSYYQFDTPYSFYNLTLPAGCYLPIDYDHAGSFSNASRPNSPLHDVYLPEEIYGRYM